MFVETNLLLLNELRDTAQIGVLNLLPIPVLDGGQLTLLAIEAVRGKPFTEKTENFIYTGGALMVGALMIFAIFNDISRFI